MFWLWFLSCSYLSSFIIVYKVFFIYIVRFYSRTLYFKVIVQLGIIYICIVNNEVLRTEIIFYAICNTLLRFLFSMPHDISFTSFSPLLYTDSISGEKSCIEIGRVPGEKNKRLKMTGTCLTWGANLGTTYQVGSFTLCDRNWKLGLIIFGKKQNKSRKKPCSCNIDIFL